MGICNLNLTASGAIGTNEIVVFYKKQKKVEYKKKSLIINAIKEVKELININNNTNKQCMENILLHLTKLIQLSEFENIKDLSKLIDMSTSISAQLLAIDGYDENEIDQYSTYNTNSFSGKVN